VRDENGLLSVVDEEVQRAGGRVEVDLQHHRRSCVELLVSEFTVAPLRNISFCAAIENKEKREVRRKRDLQ
jgi:hypothetical protein